MVASSSLVLLCALFGAGDDTVLLDFTATWCGPCRMMAPTVDRLAAAGMPVRKVDIDQQPELAERFQVRGVPCFVMLVNGQEVDRVVGPASFDRLAQMCQRGRSATTSPPADPRTTFVGAPVPGGSGFGRGSSLTAEGATGNRMPSAAPAPRNVPAHLQGGAFAPRSAPPPQRPAGFEPSPTIHTADDVHPAPAPQPVARVEETAARDVYATVSPAERAMAATVKLEVDDSRGMSFGTGTIIDRNGQDALIVTCGHIFRDSEGKGQIKVFAQALGGQNPLPGRVLHFDLERDIALVAFRPTGAVGVAPVVAAGYTPLTDTSVFSIGCNKGADPTIMQGRVLSLGKRYIRPAGEALLPLLEVSGRPVDGRSGGGLFTADGRLAGVCNFADQQDDRGLYACPATIQAELDRNKLSYVYQRNNAVPPTSFAAAPPASAAMALPPAMTPPPAMSGDPTFSLSSRDLGMGRPTQAELDAAANPGPGKVVCIVPSPNHPGGTQMLLIERPSPALMELLTREGRIAGGPVAAGPSPGGTIVRGQNP